MTNSITDCGSGVCLIAFPSANRRIQFCALDDGSCVVLLDAGLPDCATEWLKTRISSAPVRGIIISHADADHFGGAAVVRDQYPSATILAHVSDGRWIESPKSLVEERYNCAYKRFGTGYGETMLSSLLDVCGGGALVDATLAEGDELRIGAGTWRVLHVPGHSPGHIALYNERTRVLLLGDAALGFGVPDLNRGIAMPPTHQFIADYLATLDRLGRLPVDMALTGHWPLLDRSGFAQLIKDSRECVLRDLAFIQDLIRGGSSHFADLLQALNERFRVWPESADIHYFYALAGYVDYLESKGELRVENGLIRGS